MCVVSIEVSVGSNHWESGDRIQIHPRLIASRTASRRLLDGLGDEFLTSPCALPYAVSSGSGSATTPHGSDSKVLTMRGLNWIR